MKKLFITFGLIAANIAFAGAEIEWTSDNIPAEIRARIEQTVSSRCEIYGNGLKEFASEVRVDRVDQGVIDYFYTVTLSTKQRIDQMIFEDVEAVQIEVAQYSFSNPTAGDPIQVELLQGLNAGSCK